MPNGVSTMRQPPPTSKGTATMESIWNTLPNVGFTAAMMVTVRLLCNEPGDMHPLGTFPEQHFTEEEPKRCIKAFQEHLSQISAAIERRNESLPLKYTYLNPKVIENSVSIQLLLASKKCHLAFKAKGKYLPFEQTSLGLHCSVLSVIGELLPQDSVPLALLTGHCTRVDVSKLKPLSSGPRYTAETRGSSYLCMGSSRNLESRNYSITPVWGLAGIWTGTVYCK